MTTPQETPATPPLDWDHSVDEASSGLDIARHATSDECRRVAEALEILGCESLQARYTVAPRSGGRFRVRGHVEARVTQACIVSLDPVPETVSEQFDVEYRPHALSRRAAHARPKDDVSEALGDPNLGAPILNTEDVEPIHNGRLDVGRLVYECLATGLDPFPRAAGAELEAKEATGSVAEAGNPFAALARLKRDT